MDAVRLAREAFFAARDLVLPPHCAGCGAGIDGGWWCDPCRRLLQPIRPPRCEACSQPFSGAITGPFVCPNCHGRAFHFETAVAAFSSRGSLRELIHLLKYAKARWASKPLAELASLALEDPRLQPAPEVLVPVPLHPLRQRERGFNQSELIARELSRLSGIPVSLPLVRIRATQTQTHFDRNQRMRNLRGAFALGQNASVSGLSILLVDDVLTTGSTLDECARVLLAAGSGRVRALTVGRG